MDYDWPMDMNARIYRARKDAGLTQDELASAVGKTRGAVAQWESGDVRPRHATLVAIAKATGKPLMWLESGIGSEKIGLDVVGEVAAGTWLEGTVEFDAYTQAVAPHPDYPASSQRLYKVKGTSVNRIVGNGEYVHCVSLEDGGITLRTGDLVIVCRRQHGKCEYTAKRYIIENGHQILRPESDDAAWQDDVEINGDSDTEIVITDIVIAKWSPLRRGSI